MSCPNYDLAIKEAKKLRKDLCLFSPPIPILEVASELGLKVIEMDLSSTRQVFGDNAVSGLLDSEAKIIYLEISDSPSHKRFTIAHELGHWLLHGHEPDVYFRRPMGGETDPKEQEANCFAANLLVPIELLKDFASSLSEQDLAELFAVSRQVIGYRLKYAS